MTKEQLLDQSLRQFLEHGIRKLTVKTIAAPMGISTKTIYKHFKSKDQLLEACLAYHYQVLKDDFDDYAEEQINPLMSLFKLFASNMHHALRSSAIFMDDLNHYYPQLHDKVLAQQIPLYNETIINAINDAKSHGLVRQAVNPAIALQALWVLNNAITHTHSYNKLNFPEGELAANTVIAYLRGLCTADGAKMIDGYTQTKVSVG